jgi:hypothetical protein
VGCVGILLNAYRLKLLPDLTDAYRRLARRAHTSLHRCSKTF